MVVNGYAFDRKRHMAIMATQTMLAQFVDPFIESDDPSRPSQDSAMVNQQHPLLNGGQFVIGKFNHCYHSHALGYGQLVFGLPVIGLHLLLATIQRATARALLFASLLPRSWIFVAGQRRGVYHLVLSLSRPYSPLLMILSHYIYCVNDMRRKYRQVYTGIMTKRVNIGIGAQPREWCDLVRLGAYRG